MLLKNLLRSSVKTGLKCSNNIQAIYLNNKLFQNNFIRPTWKNISFPYILSKKFSTYEEKLDFQKSYDMILEHLKQENITIIELTKNFTNLKFDPTKPKSFIERYENKYAKVLNLIVDLQLKDFLEEFYFNPSLTLQKVDNFENLVALKFYVTRSFIKGGLIEILCFYSLAYATFQNNKNLKAYKDLAPPEITKCLKDINDLSEITSEELLMLKKGLVKYFELSTRNWDPVSNELMDFIRDCLKSKSFSWDLAFLYDILKTIGVKAQLRETKLDQLQSYETPFENLVPKSLKISTDSPFEAGSRDSLVGKICDKTMLFFTENRIENISQLDLACNILAMCNVDFIEISSEISRSLGRLIENKQIDDGSNIISLIKLLCYKLDHSNSFQLEILRKMVAPIYKELLRFDLSRTDCIEIYKIFRVTKSFSTELLKKIEQSLENILSQQNSFLILNIFFFYASIPKAFRQDIDPKTLVFHLRKYEYDLEAITDIAIASIFMGYEGKVDTIPQLPILDPELWNKIFENFMGVNHNNISLLQKLKLYRALKILSLVLRKDIFNTDIIENKLRSMATDLEKLNNPLESEFQKDVEKSLVLVTKKYEKEAMIEGLFSVDFLLKKKKTVIEVNGPHHYHLVFEDSGQIYHETRSSQIKEELLKDLKYNFFSIPFFEWINMSDKEKTRLLTKINSK